MSAPRWAQDLVLDVAIAEGRDDVPGLTWRKSMYPKSYGGQWHVRGGYISVSIGARLPHQMARIVILHELAHWLTPDDQFHSAAFWDTAWRLFRTYRVPPRMALANEGNYRVGARAAYKRQAAEKKE